MGLNGASRDGVSQGETIKLTIQYQDQAGNFVDPSSFPTITILDANNNVVLTAGGKHHVDADDDDYKDEEFIHYRHHEEYEHDDDNNHHHHKHHRVQRLDRGLFAFNFTIPNHALLGAWKDMWSVLVNGTQFNKTLNFNVIRQTSPIIANAGQELDPLLSQESIQNVLDLMKLLRLRVASDGQRRKRDQFGAYILDTNGNFIMEPCNVFSTDELYAFLRASLAEFNSIPHFTAFNFDNKLFVETFKHELVEGAMIMALVKQALVEKGREFQMTDDALSYQPPQIAEMLKGIYSDLMTSYRERLKFIKCQFKPSPRGFGTIYSLAGAGISPSFLRLRHLRERQII